MIQVPETNRNRVSATRAFQRQPQGTYRIIFQSKLDCLVFDEPFYLLSLRFNVSVSTSPHSIQVQLETRSI